MLFLGGEGEGNGRNNFNTRITGMILFFYNSEEEPQRKHEPKRDIVPTPPPPPPPPPPQPSNIKQDEGNGSYRDMVELKKLQIMEKILYN